MMIISCKDDSNNSSGSSLPQRGKALPFDAWHDDAQGPAAIADDVSSRQYYGRHHIIAHTDIVIYTLEVELLRGR